MTEYFYKLLSILLVITLIAVGAGWLLAARDLRQARAELLVEQGVTTKLRGAIAVQNDAVAQLVAAKLAAEARGLAAQQLAAANGRRFDGALARIAGARATTCAEAMPAVRQLLEGVR